MKKRNNTAAENAMRAPCTLDEEARALLTRAAKAVGIEIVEWVGDQANVNMDGGHYGWNPLASWGKGEALSLAVKLRLGLIPLEGGGWDVERFDERGNGRTLASCANSSAWALQQTIVEAAAKLGDLGAPGRSAHGVPPSRVGPEGWKRLAESQQALAEIDQRTKEISERYGLDDAGVGPSDAPSLTDEERAVIAAGGSVFKNCYVENAIPAAGVAPSQTPSRNWWCPTCQGEVPPERVTYEETHDPRAGGCGSRVLDRAPGVDGSEHQVKE